MNFQSPGSYKKNNKKHKQNNKMIRNLNMKMHNKESM